MSCIKKIPSFRCFLIITLVFLCCTGCTDEYEQGEGFPMDGCELIWSSDKYCAFTSMIQYDDGYYMSFREGETHVANNDFGNIRILYSKEGLVWNTYEILSLPNVDLRDPYFSINPDGMLVLSCGGRIYEDGKYIISTYVSVISKDRKFTNLEMISVLDNPQLSSLWLWRLAWLNGEGYGLGYGEQGLYLLMTKDAKSFTIVSHIQIGTNPSEGVIKFDAEGKMVALIRTEQTAYIGYSFPPYTDWIWNDIGVFLGGPDLLILNDDTYLCAGRSITKESIYDTSIFAYQNGKMTQLASFPSYGDSDSGYPAMIIKGTDLWMSFYSRRYSYVWEPSIYIYKISLQNLLSKIN